MVKLDVAMLLPLHSFNLVHAMEYGIMFIFRSIFLIGDPELYNYVMRGGIGVSNGRVEKHRSTRRARA